MKTEPLTPRAPWYRRNRRELCFWSGFAGLLVLPTLTSLALGLLPVWIVAGLLSGVLFVSGLFALVDRDARA